MVGDLILYLALIQLGAVTAITAAVVGTLFLIYRSVPNRNSEICGVDDKYPTQYEANSFLKKALRSESQHSGRTATP